MNTYSKTCVKRPLSKRPKNGFQGRLSLNAGQKYCGEHSAILSTIIKLPVAIKTFVLSIFEWPFYTGFTVVYRYELSWLSKWRICTWHRGNGPSCQCKFFISFCYVILKLLNPLLNTFANRADPDQAALVRAAWSGSTLFAYGNLRYDFFVLYTNVKVYLYNYS